MQTTEIKCDQCAKDLTYTGNCEDYYLTLHSSSKASRGGCVTLMAIRPPIGRAHHFCGLSCLDKWRDRERLYDKLMGERWNQWKEENGTKQEDGRIYSYPSPPDDVYAVWEAESRAAVDASLSA